MKIRVLAVAGVCVLALSVAAGAAPKKAAAGKCASAAEMSAQYTTAIQQELMDAALTCGETARVNYNAFQTRFGPELRVSDQLMLKMFARVMGGKQGDKAYNLFKTELAAKAELRRTHDHDEFCQGATLLAGAALGPGSLRLAEFVEDVPPAALTGGVSGCVLPAVATPNVIPQPNPLRTAAATPSAAPAATAAPHS
jgi:hypothetical protein